MTPCILGLGCAWFGGDKSSDKDTIEGVRHAIELGLDYAAATAEVPPEIWRAFKVEFGVGL